MGLWLIGNGKDAFYAGEVIAAWAKGIYSKL
jgi:hypothetical protein